MVVGRRVLGAYVMALCGGGGLAEKDKRISGGGEEGGDEIKWEDEGRAAFSGEKGEEVRREVVKGVLEAQGMAGWCEEQVS
jgi:COP9 signalosome complex subunit 4